MAAASAIVVNDRPGGHHFGGTFNLDAGNIAAGGREVETVAIPGAVPGDVLIVKARPAIALIINNERISAAGAGEFILENNTAGAIDLGVTAFDFQLIRGTTGPLR